MYSCDPTFWSKYVNCRAHRESEIIWYYSHEHGTVHGTVHCIWCLYGIIHMNMVRWTVYGVYMVLFT